ncbi:hypothetical protein O181_055722 [Austropuccinia psidii MF-1]|uniref:Uncharacterized protein n=1 Tax=Austropuccinia psidii MF-1 TaxID=1389203 RepID=A0A9Q3E9E4_9BASI|nr:hypothetical protein [Austropuccinia psidii MF-1]
MSSSNPHKSCSGSVPDSNSESSIEYVLTQSPMSPKIPLTTPISSSMLVAGLKTDVGDATSQNSRTWSIPNISVTPIPPNPANTQMQVSEGSGSTQEISPKADPQLKFPQDFLLNPHQNPVASQEPFGKSKQLNLNIPSGSQAYLGHEKWVDGGKKMTIMKCYLECSFRGIPGLILHESKSFASWSIKFLTDELYASSTLVHKEKLTGHHHPYASKARTAHSSSSTEIIVDDEDENMSPNYSETNDEPRRENFTAHEEGTQSNSEFTHPQMPLSQSMLEQS